MWIADGWNDYEVLDTSAGEKLERWGDYILVRPDPQVIWNTPHKVREWKQKNGHYHRSNKGGGQWEFFDLPEQWEISYGNLKFHLKPFHFKHTGLFPEQAVNWEWSGNLIREAKKKNPGKEIKVLNLFAYTGGATVACADAGAAVTHVDASKGMVTWAKDNAAAYLEFLLELTIKADINELVISVDNYTPAAHNAFYNIKEQGKVVDYVILMAYDEHYQGSEESGSVSSLEFVKNGVASMVASVPKERVVAALPFYTRLWKESKSKGGKPTSQAYGMSAAETILKSHDTTAKWDDTTGQYFAQYKDGGYTYKIWLEEETSLGKKMDEVAKQKVAGFAFWKLGCERPATWSTIQKYCK